MSDKSNFRFYMGRILAAPLYGFNACQDLLMVIAGLVDTDTTLTESEREDIIIAWSHTYKTMMEEKYNEL